jgi:hypothetical protein
LVFSERILRGFTDEVEHAWEFEVGSLKKAAGVVIKINHPQQQKDRCK